MAKQDDSSEWYRLPDRVTGGGDPVDGNPFPPDDPLHAVWREATWRTEEALIRLNLGAVAAWTSSPTGVATRLVVAKFDAWAERGLCGMWCDRAVMHYNQWLAIYAKTWLDDLGQSYAPATPPIPMDLVIRDVRARLDVRVHHWQAAARARRAAHEAELTSPSSALTGASGANVWRTVLGDNPYGALDPDHEEWTTTARMLANLEARLEAAFVGSPSPYLVTVVDWLASWAVAAYDAVAKARMMALVKDKGDAGREVYRDALDALREHTVRALRHLYACLSAHAQSMMRAFPGGTASNEDGRAFLENVDHQLMPEVTERLYRRKSHWWLTASMMVRDDEEQLGAREAALSRSTSAVENRGPAAHPERQLPVSETSLSASAAPDPSRGPDEQMRAQGVGTSNAEDPNEARMWEAIEIRFLSELTFQAMVDGQVHPPQTYVEAGFGDGRHRHGRPKAAWETLRELAESDGVLRTAPKWPRLEKRIQEIRALLRAHFRLPGDPVPYRDGAYRARFRIGVNHSYGQ